MAVDSGYQRSKKRKRKKPKRKILIGEQVEVLYSDEGLSGSWHTGIVVGCGECNRLVEYTYLMSEDDTSKLRESITVSSSIEGLPGKTPKSHRGNIRPLPPCFEIKESEIKYGLCVDALVDDAWWEGVVFDRYGSSNERLIFFPDQGDQQMVALDHLRLTQEWNEVSGHWKPRGEWLMLQVLQPFEKEEELPVSVREIWFDLRTMDAFSDKIGQWTSGSQSTWHILVSELIQELRSVVFGVLTSNNSLCPISHTLDDHPLSNESFSHIATENMYLEGSKGDRGSKNSVFHDGITCSLIVKAKDACEIHSRVDVTKSPGAEGIWKPLEDLEAAYFPEAVKVCASVDGGLQVKEFMVTDDNLYNVRLKAKKHLLALGWKIESRPRTETMLRVRFTSPEGKFYYSLHKACVALLNGHQKWTNKCGNNNNIDTSCLISNVQTEESQSLSKNVSEMISPVNNEVLPSIVFKGHVCVNSEELPSNVCEGTVCVSNEELPSNFFEGNVSEMISPVWDGLEPENIPEAVLEYKSYFDLLKGNKEFSYDLSMMKLNARKHLKCMGWKFWIKGQHKRELFITSPCGKPFKSLYSACEEYLREENLDNSSAGASLRRVGANKLVMKRNKILKRRKIISDFASFSFGISQSSVSKNSVREKETQTIKGPQLNVVQTPNQSVPKSVLSFLIDNDLVFLQQKVSYIRKRDGQVLKEGHITRDGIKCVCCKMVYTLSKFEAHAGSTYRRPAASIFLEDGRSLLQCKMQMIHCKKPKDFQRLRLKGYFSGNKSDTICSVCHYAGSLVLCDHCPSSFHLGCVGLENLPKGNWFCPPCRCSVCGMSEFNSNAEQFTEKTVLFCDQCEREYHVGCVRKKGSRSLSSCPAGNWFCSKKCSKIFCHLRQLLGKSIPTAVKGLSWTILRSSRENGVDNLQFDAETTTEHDSKLCVALNVLHECFISIIEPRTQSDIVADLIFNKESELRRLNFYGFYTILLEKGDELVSVAAFRVYGAKVAEMPLIGTRVKYRRQGMCRLLVNEVEKLLSELGVETLLLPAVPQLLRTWTSSFGFSKMSNYDKLNFLEYTILNFQDSTVCQKLLRRALTVRMKPKEDCKEFTDISSRSNEKVDSELCSNVVEMVEPIKPLPCGDGDHLGQIGDQTDAEHSPISTCINSLGQAEPETRVNGLVNGVVSVTSNKCMISNVAADPSPTFALKSHTNLNFEFGGKRYEQVKNVDNGITSTFKYFYKRRRLTNKYSLAQNGSC